VVGFLATRLPDLSGGESFYGLPSADEDVGRINASRPRLEAGAAKLARQPTSDFFCSSLQG